MLTDEPKKNQLRHNPKGMFEVGGLMGMGKLLQQATNITKNYKQISEDLEEEMRPFLNRIPPEGNWGFKGPGYQGTGVLVHYMENPHIVYIMRNPVNQAKSFQMFRLKNDGIKSPFLDLLREMADHALMTAILAQELQQMGYPVAFVTYEDLKSQPLEEAERLAEFLGVEMTEEIRKKVLDFVDPDIHTWQNKGNDVEPIELEILNDSIEPAPGVV